MTHLITIHIYRKVLRNQPTLLIVFIQQVMCLVFHVVIALDY